MPIVGYSRTYGTPAFQCDAVVFDGTNDWMTRGGTLSGLSDSKLWLCSHWIKFNGSNATLQIMLRSGVGFFQINKGTDNKIAITGFNAGVTKILEVFSTTTYTSGATWFNILTAGNLATGTAQLYVNDVDVLAGGGIITNDTIDYTQPDWAIGAAVDGTFKINADLAEFYATFSETLDLSVTANRRKFISASGKPADLGSNGATPTGNQPIIYQSVRPGDAASDFATNRGTGGNFSITGALAIASSSPSD